MATSARADRYYRFTPGQRVEHAILILSFTILSITGLPQMFPDTWIGAGMIWLMGGIETVRIIHRIAAVVLIVQSIYHVIILGYRVWVVRRPMTMLPGWDDAKDAVQTLGFNVGVVSDPPRMGRYTFGEKVEYWAVIWGTVIMILTGFMLWNPILITHYLPGQLIPAAKAAHGGEALLAVLSIVMWHAYNVHIKHFNRSMFTGYLDRHVMEEEHPLELESPPTDDRASNPEAVRRRAKIYMPIAVVMGILLLGSAYFFLTIETTAIETVPRQEVESFVPAETPEP